MRSPPQTKLTIGLKYLEICHVWSGISQVLYWELKLFEIKRHIYFSLLLCTVSIQDVCDHVSLQHPVFYCSNFTLPYSSCSAFYSHKITVSTSFFCFQCTPVTVKFFRLSFITFPWNFSDLVLTANIFPFSIYFPEDFLKYTFIVFLAFLDESSSLSLLHLWCLAV